MDFIDDKLICISILALPYQQQVGESNIDFKRFKYYMDLELEDH